MRNTWGESRKVSQGGIFMTREARIMAGIILLTVPTIQYGGYFLLTSLRDRSSHYMDNALRQNFFRAGHAHAGVFVILSLLCQILADSASLPAFWMWVARIGVPIAAILIPAGFFLSMTSPTATEPNGLVSLIYFGIVALAASVITLGVGLLRAAAA
jgi:Ni,Fe-hydrogenase I cytochrome b subunit